MFAERTATIVDAPVELAAEVHSGKEVRYFPNGTLELVRSFDAALNRSDNLLAFIKRFTQLFHQLFEGNLPSTSSSMISV